MAERRDSSPMRTLATFGLLIGQAAVGAAAPLRSASPDSLMLQAPQAPARRSSRMEEDSRRAFALAMHDGLHVPGWEDAVEWVPSDFTDTPTSSGRPSRTGSPTISHITVSHTPPAALSPRGQPVQQRPDGSIFVPGPAAPQPSPASPTPAPAPAAAPAAHAPAYAPAASAQKPMQSSPSPSAIPADKALFDGLDAKTNAAAIVWRGDKAATFHVYANSGPYQPGLGAPFKVVHVEAGSYQTVTLPNAFSGRVQLMSGDAGRADDDATWAEIAYDQWNGLSFFDVSLIRGVNAGVSMRSSDGTAIAAVPASIVRDAPAGVRVTDSGGASVIHNTEGYDGVIRHDVMDYLDSKTDTVNAYIRNNDDTATHATQDHHLVLEFSV